MKKIFLTGDVHVGKSAIIENYLKRNREYDKIIAGFRSKLLVKDQGELGYYLEDVLLQDQDYTLAGVNRHFPDAGKKEGVPDVFDTRGTEILSRALESSCDLIIMDELGFFELNAKKFKEKVFEVLDSEKKVLGVLKKRSNPFLEAVKNHKDVSVIEVTLENRENIVKEIEQIWRDTHEI